MSITLLWQKYVGSFFRLVHPDEVEITDPSLLFPVSNRVNLLHSIDNRVKSRPISSLPFDTAISLGQYSNEYDGSKTDLGQLIFLMKYRYDRQAAERLLEFACQQTSKIKLRHHPDLVVSIPDSIVNRPFSPTKLIASGLAEYYYADHAADLIRRKRLTLPQKNRSWIEKTSDGRLRYRLSDRKTVFGKHILLFDDIFDTGQTVMEAGRHLRSAGAKSITLIVLANLGHNRPVY